MRHGRGQVTLRASFPNARLPTCLGWWHYQDEHRYFNWPLLPSKSMVRLFSSAYAGILRRCPTLWPS
ncbi:hypothetical protein M404DRAFT_513583 [Pisolithus tinctorius Marx 270]|uniref:Uncharacterized protein n=1 Tax=Pisolithus tinctorius Marx 270 TaxID=870435 RepID=A0A0C3NXW3_PISTI|nr:hypothetical protein M404DRAFT_513583 [Pisolithus tinctorius Marx 270]